MAQPEVNSLDLFELGYEAMDEKSFNDAAHQLIKGYFMPRPEGWQPPEDPDNGEFAELHPDFSPPSLGGLALTGRFNRDLAPAA